MLQQTPTNVVLDVVNYFTVVFSERSNLISETDLDFKNFPEEHVISDPSRSFVPTTLDEYTPTRGASIEISRS